MHFSEPPPLFIPLSSPLILCSENDYLFSGWYVPCWFQLQALCVNGSLCLSCFPSICAIVAYSVLFRIILKMTFSETSSKVVSAIMSLCFSLCLTLIFPLFSYGLICDYLSIWGRTLHEVTFCLLQGIGQLLLYRGNPINICGTID